jgi:hypothetical protein
VASARYHCLTSVARPVAGLIPVTTTFGGMAHPNDVAVRSVNDFEVGTGTAVDGEQLVLLSLGSLTPGADYQQAWTRQGPVAAMLPFVMDRERARALAHALLAAVDD